jgi:hypothetical protein
VTIEQTSSNDRYRKERNDWPGFELVGPPNSLISWKLRRHTAAALLGRADAAQESNSATRCCGKTRTVAE